MDIIAAMKEEPSDGNEIALNEAVLSAVLISESNYQERITPLVKKLASLQKNPLHRQIREILSLGQHPLTLKQWFGTEGKDDEMFALAVANFIWQRIKKEWPKIYQAVYDFNAKIADSTRGPIDLFAKSHRRHTDVPIVFNQPVINSTAEYRSATRTVISNKDPLAALDELMSATFIPPYPPGSLSRFNSIIADYIHELGHDFINRMNETIDLYDTPWGQIISELLAIIAEHSVGFYYTRNERTVTDDLIDACQVIPTPYPRAKSVLLKPVRLVPRTQIKTAGALHYPHCWFKPKRILPLKTRSPFDVDVVVVAQVRRIEILIKALSQLGMSTPKLGLLIRAKVDQDNQNRLVHSQTQSAENQTPAEFFNGEYFESLLVGLYEAEFERQLISNPDSTLSKSELIGKIAQLSKSYLEKLAASFDYATNLKNLGMNTIIVEEILKRFKLIKSLAEQ